MLALLFYVLPEEAKDYEYWLSSNYDDKEYDDEYNDEDEYDDYYERYNSYSMYHDDFVKQIFFDEILSNFVNSLSEEEIKNTLIEELKRNEKYTFDKYLQKIEKECKEKSYIDGYLFLGLVCLERFYS